VAARPEQPGSRLVVPDTANDEAQLINGICENVQYPVEVPNLS